MFEMGLSNDVLQLENDGGPPYFQGSAIASK